jgi:hypothetical protein
MKWILATALTARLVAYQAESGSIEGTVVNGVTNAPVKRARITVLRRTPGPAPQNVASDMEGRFRISGLEPGTYVLIANHHSYPIAFRGQGRTALSTVVVAAGERAQVTLKLTPPSAISGTIIDAEGDPVSGCSVDAYTAEYENGTLKLLGRGQATSDDRGEYRISTLPPGAYYVHVRPPRPPERFPLLPKDAPRPPPAEIWPAMFYPGAVEFSQASRVNLQPGAEMFGADFKLRPSRVTAVRGRLAGVPANARVTAINLIRNDSPLTRDHLTTTVRGAGFSFDAVLPGSYTLIASAIADGRTYSAMLPLDVGARGVGELELTPMPAADIAGRIRFDGEPPKTNRTGVVLLHPASGAFGMVSGLPTGEIAADGSFTVANVIPGPYRVHVANTGQNTFVKSILFAGQPVAPPLLNVAPGTAGPLDIVLSTALAEVTVTADAGADTIIVVIPEGPRKYIDTEHRVLSTFPSGSATVSLAPGKYKIAAVPEVDSSAHSVPEVIEAIDKSGTPVTVEEGARVSVAARVVSIP